MCWRTKGLKKQNCLLLNWIIVGFPTSVILVTHHMLGSRETNNSALKTHQLFSWNSLFMPPAVNLQFQFCITRLVFQYVYKENNIVATPMENSHFRLLLVLWYYSLLQFNPTCYSRKIIDYRPITHTPSSIVSSLYKVAL